MSSPSPLDPRDEEMLIALFRRTIHEANNELMMLIQECELALMKDDPAVPRKALEFAIERAMAISRLHRAARQEILDRIQRSGSGEADHGHLDRSHGGDPAGRPEAPDS